MLVLKDFEKNPPVIMSVSGGEVRMGYRGDNETFNRSVPLEGARFLAEKASRLGLTQVEDAFRAAHASEADRRGFARAVYDRMRQVVATVRHRP